MRVLKIYWRGVNCWVDCEGQNEVQDDERTAQIEPDACDEDARLNQELDNPVATLIRR